MALLHKESTTISTCWADAGCDGSISPICEYAIRSKSACTSHPYPYGTSTSDALCSPPSLSNSRCPRESQAHNLTLPIRTILLQQTDDLLTGQQLDTGNCLSVPNGNSNLRGRKSLLGHSDDKVSDGARGVSHPSSSPALEWSDRRTDTLALSLRLNSAHILIFIK